jgi:hypothetical protein
MKTDAQAENAMRAETFGKEHKKRAYKKPSFRYERVFVTSALSCGKVNVTQASCTLNRKLS